jgi:hypothetical protein
MALIYITCNVQSYIDSKILNIPIPVTARSKAVSVAAGLLRLRVRVLPGHEYLSLVNVACCQIEYSATGRSLVRRSPAEWCICHGV